MKTMNSNTYAKLKDLWKELIDTITVENFTYETNIYSLVHFVHEISISTGNQSTLGNNISEKVENILKSMKLWNFDEIPEVIINNEEKKKFKLAINKFLNINNFNAAEICFQLLVKIKTESIVAKIYRIRLLCNKNDYVAAWNQIQKIEIPKNINDKFIYFSTKFDILTQRHNIAEWKYFHNQIKEHLSNDSNLEKITKIQMLKLEGQFEKAINLQLKEIKKKTKINEIPPYILSIEYSTLGILYLSARKFQSAIQSFQTALEFNPNSLNIKYQLGNAFEGKMDYKNAIKIYTDILEYDPTNPKVLNNLANMISRNGDPEIAIRMLKKISQKSYYIDKNGYYYKNLALAYFRKGDMTKAEQNHNKALEVDPTNHQFYYHRGTFYLNTEKYEKSEKDLLKAIEIFPDHPDYWNQLGNVYLDPNRIENAIDAFKKCLKLDPVHFSALSNLGLIYFSSNKYEKALKFFQKANDSCPSQFLPYFYQGVILLKRIQYKTALKYFQIALKLEKPTKLMQDRFEKFELDILSGLYHCFFELQQNEEAIGTGKKLINKTETYIELNKPFISYIEPVDDPTSFLLIINRNYAMVLERLKRYDKAIKVLKDRRKTSSFLFDENHRARSLLLTCFMQIHKRNFEKARKTIIQALSYHETPLNYLILGYINYKLKSGNYQTYLNSSAQLLNERYIHPPLYFENLKSIFEFSEKFRFIPILKHNPAFLQHLSPLTQTIFSNQSFSETPFQLWYKLVYFGICLDCTQEFMIQKLEELNNLSENKFSEWLDYWEMLLHLCIKYSNKEKIMRVLKKMFAINPNYKIRSKLWKNELIGKKKVLKLRLSEKIKQQKQIDLTEEKYKHKFRNRGFWHKGEYYIILDTGETGSEFREGPNNYFIKDIFPTDNFSQNTDINNDRLHKQEKRNYSELLEKLDTQVFLNDNTETNFQSTLADIFKINNSKTMNYFLSENDIQIIRDYNDLIKNKPDLFKKYGIIQYGDIIGYFLQHIEEDKKGNHSLIWIKGTSGNIGRLSETFLEIVGLSLLDSDMLEIVNSSAQGRLLRTFTAESKSYEPFFTIAGKSLKEPFSKIPFVYNDKRHHNKSKMVYFDYLIPTQLIQFCNPEQGSISADRRGRVKRKYLQEWHILDDQNKITEITKVLLNAIRSLFLVQFGKKNKDQISKYKNRYTITELVYFSSYHRKNLTNKTWFSKILTNSEQFHLLMSKFAKKTKEGNMIISDESRLSEISDKIEIWNYVNPGIIDYSEKLPNFKLEQMMKEIYHPIQHPITLIDGEIGCGKSVLLGQLAINHFDQKNPLYIMKPFVSLPRIPEIKPDALIIIDNIDALSDHQLQTLNLWFNIEEIHIIATIRSEKMKSFRDRYNILNSPPNSLSRWHSIKFPKWTNEEIARLIDHEMNFWGIATEIQDIHKAIIEISNNNCTFSTGLVKNIRFKEKKIFTRSDLFIPVATMGSKILRILSELYLDDNNQIISENALNELKLMWIIIAAYRKVPIEQIEQDLYHYSGLPNFVYKKLIQKFPVDMQDSSSFLNKLFQSTIDDSLIKIPPNLAWIQFILDIRNAAKILYMRNKQGNSSFFELDRWGQILKIFQRIQDEQGNEILNILRETIQEIVHVKDFNSHSLISIVSFTIGFYYDKAFMDYFPVDYWNPKNFLQIFKNFKDNEMILFTQITLSSILHTYMPISIEVPSEIIFDSLKKVEDLILFFESRRKVKIPSLIKTQLFGFQGKFYFHFKKIEKSLDAFLKISSLSDFSELDLDIQMEILEEISSIYFIQKDPEKMEKWVYKLKAADKKMRECLNHFPKVIQPHLHELHASYLVILSHYYDLKEDAEKMEELLVEAEMYAKEWNVNLEKFDT